MNRRADVVKDTRELIVTRLITLPAKIRLELDNYPERWRRSCQVPARIRGITGPRTEKLSRFPREKEFSDLTREGLGEREHALQSNSQSIWDKI